MAYLANDDNGDLDSIPRLMELINYCDDLTEEELEDEDWPFRRKEALAELESRLKKYKRHINNWKDSRGWTFLHFACGTKHYPVDLDVLELLIKYDADLNIENRQGKTPLRMLKEKNIPSRIMNALLSDPSYSSIVNARAPMCPAKSVVGKPSILNLFQKYAVGTSTSELDGKFALHVALNDSNCSLLFIKELLQSYPSLINIQDDLSKTPLHIAIENNKDIGIIEELLARGAFVNCGDSFLSSPLHIAVKYYVKKLPLLKLLFKYGANVNAFDYNKSTPLLFALTGEINLEVVEALLYHGADPNAVNNNSLSLFTVAPMDTINGLNAARLLLKFGAEPVFCEILDHQSFFNKEAGKKFKLLILQFLIMRNIKNYITHSNCDDAVIKKQRKKIIGVPKNPYKDLSKLTLFGDRCMKEILKMRRDKLTDSCSFYEFVSEQYSYGWVKEKYCDLDMIVQVLHRLKKNSYLHCDELISLSLNRDSFLAVLKDIKADVIGFESNIIEGRRKFACCMDNVGKYLSKKDLINLLLACSKTNSKQSCSYFVRIECEKYEYPKKRFKYASHKFY